ncbi:MAG: DUF123 domain-containing protein [Acidobacteriota bacterium]
METRTRRDSGPLGSEAGTYALMLRASSEQMIQIGRLGRLHLRPGFYLYVGSALGPGGLAARLGRHCRSCHSPHWHIDYLKPSLALQEIWYTRDPERREHQWANLFGDMAGASVPLPRFGASDCCCDSHLFFFSDRPSIRQFQLLASKTGAASSPIQRSTPP